jgi:hypothetical protein
VYFLIVNVFFSETLMQERHFTSGKMNIHIDSLTSKEKRLASLLHKTRQDAKQIILSKNLDMYGMEEYIVFYLKSRQENFARLKVCVCPSI